MSDLAIAGADLFGGPSILRSAVFAGSNRVSLSRRWGAGPVALGIGCNPSLAGGEKEDPTTHWLNKWFQANGFGGYDMMNLYPFVSPSPRECRRVAEWEKNGPDWYARDALMHNLSALVLAAKSAHQVFVCWGNIAWDDVWIDHVIEQIQTGEEPWPDMWCWGKTASGAPKHPLARGKHRMSIDQPATIWRAAA